MPSLSVEWDRATRIASEAHHQSIGNRSPCMNGDCSAKFRQQLLACLPQLRAFARSMGGSNHAADDLLQATAERALAAGNRFEMGTNMMGWLFTIMRNVRTSELRSHAVRGHQSLDDLPDYRLQTPASQIAAIEKREVREALKGVPEKQREALVLITMVGCSYDEAALICGCEVGTIKSRVNRAKVRLARLLGASISKSGPPAHRGDGRTDSQTQRESGRKLALAS
jgi:RNA polymerase sigma-70 factor, ECF subfamily